MIPPIDPSILEANPNFTRLHTRLITTLLAPDASTNAINLARESTAQTLRQHQIEAAKDEILKRSLTDLVGLRSNSPSAGNEYALPAPLRELVYTISLYLNDGPAMDLTNADHALMAPEINEFRENLPEISTALSTHINAQHATLLAIAVEGTATPATPHHPKLTLHSLATTLQSQPAPTANLHTTLNTLLAFLTLQSTHLTAQITHLERHIHGTLTRHAQAHAAHLAAVAAALALKLRVMLQGALKATYTPDVQRALDNYARHLRGEVRRLRERVGELEGVVREYDGVKVGGVADEEGADVMRKLGVRYGEVLKEIEDVKADIRRLEDGQRSGSGARGKGMR